MNHQSIIIGMVCAVLTYLYMRWTKVRQDKLNKKIRPKPVNISIPLGVGVIGWFVSDSYFSRNTVPQSNNVPCAIQTHNNMMGPSNPCLVQPPVIDTKSIGSCSFQLIEVKPSSISNQFMQSAVPDVFLNEDL